MCVQEQTNQQHICYNLEYALYKRPSVMKNMYMAQGPNKPIYPNRPGNTRTAESNLLLSTEITQKYNTCLHMIQSTVTKDQ